MKQLYRSLSFIFLLAIINSLCPMDGKNNSNQEEISKEWLEAFCNFTVKSNAEVIENICGKYKEDNLSKDLTDHICAHNNEFKNAINFFVFQAQENFRCVTVKTLNQVTNPNMEQPVETLNKLPLEMKKYCMNKAFEEIKGNMLISLDGHTKRITLADVNKEKMLCVSASEDQTFRLWSISTGKQLWILPQRSIGGYIRFNSTGSAIITTTCDPHNDQLVHTKKWHIQTGELLYAKEQLKENNYPPKKLPIYIAKPEITSNRINISGLSSPYLELCKRALKKITEKKDFALLRRTKPFCCLTLYEQNHLEKQIAAKEMEIEKKL